MKKEVLNFIEANQLSPFGRNNVRQSSDSIFKTKDSKEISNKVLEVISDNFIFSDTKNILKSFVNENSAEKIKNRQNFFKSLEKKNNSDLKKLQTPKPFWKPKYDVVTVTEEESTLVALQQLNIPVVFINSQSDLPVLERYDLIQAIDCEQFGRVLERLPQVVFIERIEDIFLERHLTILSGWKNNLELLKNMSLNEELQKVVNGLYEILPFIDEKLIKKISMKDIETKLDEINKNLMDKIKLMTLSGDSLISIISKGIPKEIHTMIEEEIGKSGISEELFEIGLPLKIDQKEVDEFLKRQSTQEFANSAAVVKKNAEKIKNISKQLKVLENELVYFDFISGISRFSDKKDFYPEIDNSLYIQNSENLFLDKPQPISFNLSGNYKCSILTGANSGGKTTLLEHLIQLVTLSQLGLPVSGELKIPLFSEVYYFAKNKGSMSKGAFETLLTQMSEINPGEKTLILADEIEAVTEPGVAGQIIVSTAEFFLEKNCFLVIATHLGQEIKDILPSSCRIDGIEAKGLTENYELIVDHNPVLGRLANSTPELIVEKMAKSKQKPYFIWLHNNLKKK